VSDPTLRNDFIDREAARVAGYSGQSLQQVPTEPAAHFERVSRHAIAHVLRPAGRPTIDPDLAEDRGRLDREASLLRGLVRAAIDQEYPNAVSVQCPHLEPT